MITIPVEEKHKKSNETAKVEEKCLNKIHNLARKGKENMMATQTEKMKKSREKRSNLAFPAPRTNGLNFLFLFALLYRSCYLLFCFCVCFKPDSHEQDIFSIRNRRTKRAPPFYFRIF